MAPMFRADHVGSLLRPQELKDAFRDAARKPMGQAHLADMLDRCIRDAIKLQEDAGLQSITDGEFRRGSWFFGFVQAVDGLTTKDSLFDFRDSTGGHATFQTAYVEGKLKRTRGITTDEFAFVRANTNNAPKVTMPTPSLVHFFRLDKAVDRNIYPDMDEFWSDLIAVYREEIAVLAALGCRSVQLDEVPIAMMCDPNIRAQVTKVGIDPAELLNSYIGAINAIARNRPAGMTLSVHLCKGNYKGHWMAEGSYESVSEKLFNEADVDTFFLEYESERAGGFEPLRHVPKGKNVILGLVSSKSPQLEPLDDLRRRVDEAGRFMSLSQAGVSPQCGFASSVGGNPLSIDDERRKLARVVELANAVWGK
ncbi:MAG: 5-methyltetrahydropteroyltriglutamate--homocysteine S-methyltransferase [Xanthobacteraceae bacterium]